MLCLKKWLAYLSFSYFAFRHNRVPGKRTLGSEEINKTQHFENTGSCLQSHFAFGFGLADIVKRF
jgi:hypothetical protein